MIRLGTIQQGLRHRLLFTSVLPWILAVGLTAAAENTTVPMDPTRPAPAPQESLWMFDRGGSPLALWAPRFSLTLLGGHAPLSCSTTEGSVFTLDDSLVILVGAAVGLGMADVGVAIPLALSMTGDLDGEPWRVMALGDIALVPRVTPLVPGSSPVSLMLAIPVTIPTGRADLHTGRLGATIEPRLRLGLATGRFHLAVRPGILWQGGFTGGAPQLSNALTLRTSVGLDVDPARALRVEVGLDGLLPVTEVSSTSAEALAGFVVQPVPGLSVMVHGGFGMGTLPGIAAVRVVAGVAWEGPGRTSAPVIPEPPLAQPESEPAISTPDVDRDGDGFPDHADACPDRPGENGDECPAAGTSGVDLDRDGLPWPTDACPLQPEDLDGFDDGDGCPDLDHDNDGIPDETDACPDRGEDGAEPWPADGCPASK